MIKYRLCCDLGHEFEGWFRDSSTYDASAAAGQLACAQCGSSSVRKAVMAPNVATRTPARPAADPDALKTTPAEAEVRQTLESFRAAVEANAEYVGPRFAEEARKIHYEESEARGIYGEASRAEARSLLEEGIAILPVPAPSKGRQ